MEAAARHVASVPERRPGKPRTMSTAEGASYGTTGTIVMSRQTPFSAVIAGCDAVHGVPPGGHRFGSGRHRSVRRRARLPVVPTCRLHRGRGRPRTTLRRASSTTRDEPHADADKYRRLHVIIGDANLAETSTYLKVGTTALVPRRHRGGPRVRHRSERSRAGPSRARGPRDQPGSVVAGHRRAGRRAGADGSGAAAHLPGSGGRPAGPSTDPRPGQPMS